MSTKQNPGKYDGYRKAMEDEPIFTLLGRDKVSPMLIKAWIEVKTLLGVLSNEEHQEALKIANDMIEWRKSRW